MFEPFGGNPVHADTKGSNYCLKTMTTKTTNVEVTRTKVPFTKCPIIAKYLFVWDENGLKQIDTYYYFSEKKSGNKIGQSYNMDVDEVPKDVINEASERLHGFATELKTGKCD